MFSHFTFQLSDHDEIVNNTKSISIRFFVHLQTNLAKQVRECQDAIKVEIMKYSYAYHYVNNQIKISTIIVLILSFILFYC